jgi:hypothetical protein
MLPLCRNITHTAGVINTVGVIVKHMSQVVAYLRNLINNHYKL